MSLDGRPSVHALDVRALTKRYDDGTVALDALDLTIPNGAFFGLLGPNGAGKTTLINSVTGLVRVTSGSIRVFGHEAVGDGLASLAARARRSRRFIPPDSRGVRVSRLARRSKTSIISSARRAASRLGIP